MLLLSFLFLIPVINFIKAQDFTLEDPLPSCKGFIISSPTGITQKLGYSVDGNGDMNDDGIPDIIVSEYLTSGFSTVYLIYGTKTGYSDINVATMTSQQGFRITGLKLYGSDNTNLLSISGDIDGDGIKDIVIGASNTNSGNGVVYVIYGKQGGYTDFDISNLASPSSGFKITNPNAGYFGWSINTKADINGDKIKDIIVGASSALGSGSGAAYVIYGQKARETDVNIATMPLTRGFVISGSTNFYAGAAVGSAGDFNQDYVDDLLITAPGASSNIGKAYVFYGKNGSSFANSPLQSLLPAEGFTVTGSSGEKLAIVASDAGDFNHDGISDIVVSSWQASSNKGYAYIFYGKKGGPPNFSTSSMSASQGFKMQGESLGDKFGSSLASVEDINGDGITDLLIGAQGYATNKGAVYVIYGRTDQPSTINLNADEGFKITGTIVSGNLGYSVRSLGDINQDGVTDIIIGAPGAGKAYVLFGSNGWGCDSCSATLACSTCKSGYNYMYSGLCYKECPVFGLYKLGYQCFNKCPTNAPYNSGYQCFSGCPVSAPYNSGFECFVACPGDAPYKSDFECFTKCPVSAPYNFGYQCFTGCSGTTPYNFDFQCFSECPANAPYKVGFQCFSVQPEVVEPVSAAIKGGVTKGAATTNSANKVLNLWSPADALPFIYGQLKTSIMYMRYLNISRTQKLEEIYQLYYDSDTSAIPFISMSNSIKDSFPQEALPYMFQKYSLPSSFITNFGDDLMGLLVIFALLVLTKLAYFLLKKWIRNLATLKMILNKASITFQNFLLGSFGELLGPIIFYSTMEFRNSNNEKQYYVLSPFICSLSLVLGFGVIGICIWILTKFQTFRKTSLQESKDKEKKFALLEKKYEGVAVFFEEFDNSSLAKQSAFLVFSLKAIVESLIVGFFFEYPLLQAILLLILTLFLLAYNIIKRPFKSRISLAQQLVLVLSLFICNILLNIMAGTDLSNESFQAVKERTSQGIFWILIMFQFIPLVFFGINMIEGAWRFYKWFSSMKKPKKMNVKKPHRFAKDPDQSSFFSRDQTVLSLNQSSIQLIDFVQLPNVQLQNSSSESPSPKNTKILDVTDFAKNIVNNANSNSPEMNQSQRRKRKIARPSRKINEENLSQTSDSLFQENKGTR